MMNKSNWIVLAALGVVMASPEGVRAQQTDSTAAQASPTPAQQLSGPPPAAAPMRRVRRSWTSDNKPLEIGDIITILIDEYTLATADLQDLRDKDRDRDLSLALGLGGTSMRAAFSLGNDASERSRGEAARRERFTAEITARVTEVGPGGDAQIEGIKRLQIDQHEQAITVRGWIRSEDVSLVNTVESWRVANAEVLYESNGELQKAPGGFIAKILEYIW